MVSRLTITFFGLLFVLSCSTNETKEQLVTLTAQRDYLRTFDWSAFYFKDGYQKVDPSKVFFELDGNLVQQFDDTTLWIMPLDTQRIVVKVRSSDGTHSKNYTLKPVVNELIDSSWYKVPMGQFPTPLDQKSMLVWRNFTEYRLFGQRVPKYSHFDYLSGDTITSEIFKGKTTLLNFWYRGCMPCMAEMPALKSLKKEWESNEEVQFVSVCLDSLYRLGDEIFVGSDRVYSKEPIKDFLVETGFRHIGHGDSVAAAFFVRAYPTNMIIDSEGTIRHIRVGANPDNSNEPLARSLSDRIKELL